MINFFQHKINKNYIKYFLIFGWLSCWASLSFNPFSFFLFIESIDLDNFNKFTLFKFIDFGRGLFQTIYLPFLIAFFLILKKEKKIFFRSNIFYFLFFIIFLIEIYSTLKLDNPNINVYYIICSFNIILTLFLLKNFFSQDDIFLIFKLSVLFLVILLFFFGIQYFIVAIRDGINIYASWGNVEKIFPYDVPRPTGLARTALICLIFFINIKFFQKPFNKINFIIINISAVLIILLSSRTVLFLYFFYLTLHIFYFKIFKLKNFFTLLKNLILIPAIIIILFGIIQQITKNYNQKGKIDKFFSFSAKDIVRDYPTIDYPGIKNPQGREFTSGRFKDWQNILKYNKNPLLGNGALGDRYLINRSASNLLLYTYSSSGLVGLLIIICISLVALFHAYKNIFVNKSKFEPYKFVGSVIVIILILRSILETSYGVFGIDFILFSLCFTLITTTKDTYEPN